MPASLTYPGVYVTELPSAVHPITGVSTSTAAFVGMASRGPANQPRVLTGWGDYDRIFGGFSKLSIGDPAAVPPAMVASPSTLAYSVFQFFQNGGALAIVVRVTPKGATPATLDLRNDVKLDAASAGSWGAKLAAVVVLSASDNKLWNLTVRDLATGATEKYLNISIDPAATNTLGNALAGSALVTTATDTVLDKRPTPTTQPPSPTTDPFSSPSFYVAATGGADGTKVVTGSELVGQQATPHTGIYALLDTTEIFNMLCIPSPDPSTDIDASSLGSFVELCVKQPRDADRRSADARGTSVATL